MKWRSERETGTTTVVLSRARGVGRHEAHALLLHTAASLVGLAFDGLSLEHEASGRPVLSGAGRGWWVSLSHGRGIVAVALTRQGPIGVDVEVTRPLAADAMACRWLLPAEASWVSRQRFDHRVAAFLWLWSQKEAIGKARGRGLRGGGLLQPVPLPTQWPATVGSGHVPLPLPDDPSIALATPMISADIALAVAVAGPVNDDSLVVRWADTD